jgi:hypothetical protein
VNNRNPIHAVSLLCKHLQANGHPRTHDPLILSLRLIGADEVPNFPANNPLKTGAQLLSYKPGFALWKQRFSGVNESPLTLYRVARPFRLWSCILDVSL